MLDHTAKRIELHERYAKAMNDMNLEELRQIILDYGIVCPISGTKNWTEVRQFNLMFSTEMGSTADGSMRVYLRPETAQGIFVNFLNVQKTGRMRNPFGIAQIGKKSWIFLILSGLATGASWLCYYRALQLGQASKVVSIDKLSVVITLILAFVFLHEDFTMKSLIGCVRSGAGTLSMVL